MRQQIRQQLQQMLQQVRGSSGSSSCCFSGGLCAFFVESATLQLERTESVAESATLSDAGGALG
jgi:hypothetical protein